MKIMSRHFRAIAMKTVEEQYWTDRKQDTRLPIHRLMQKRLRLNMEELSGREPDKDSYEFTELWSGEVLHCGKEALTVVVPAHGTKVFSVIISIPQLVLSRSSFALSMRMDVM